MVKANAMDSSSCQHTLRYAEILGDLNTRLLVSGGADVNLGDICETPLVCAVQSRNLKAVECLVRRGADVNLGWETPLVCAVRSGNLKAVQFLVSSGADVNLGDGWETPLVCAVESGNLEAVKFLVRSGADVKFSYKRLNPLLYYMDSGNLAIIEFLVSNGADVDIKSDDGTLLHYAAWFASVELVEYLVRNGADVNAKDKNGVTPLYYAIHLGKLKNLIFLIDHGANINATDYHLITPLHCAVQNRNNVIYEFLRESDVWKRHDEVTEISLKIVKLLIDQGTNFSAMDEKDKTPLHEYRQLECLLDQCENLRAVDKWNPHYSARYWGFAKIIQLLLDKGADINARNQDGETPLDLARNQQCLELYNSLGNIEGPMPANSTSEHSAVHLRKP